MSAVPNERCYPFGSTMGGVADLTQRLPATRLEFLLAVDDPYGPAEAIIVIENNIVAFHPVDDAEPETIH